MINFYNVFIEVFRFLGAGVLVTFIFYFGKNWDKQLGVQSNKKNWIEKSRWWKYLTILFIAVLIGISSGSTYGTHIENRDPIYGDGDIVVDFNATKEQRYEVGLITFFVLAIPAIFGAYKGEKEAT